MKKNVENKEIEANTNNKKVNKLYIIIPIIVVILIAIGIAIFFKVTDKNYKIEEISKYLYFKSYENEKYGVIDNQGNAIIDPNYDMIVIPNPEKDIFVCYYDYDSQSGEYKTDVFNKNAEKIFKEYEQVLPLIFKEYISDVPYEKSVLKYKENNKYGIMDFKGNKVTQPIYDSIESLLYKEGCLIVKQNDKYGIINIKGKEIVKAQYDSITADGYYNENTQYKAAGFIIGNKKSDGYRYGYVNYKGKILLDTDFNEINRVSEIIDDNNVYLLAIKNGQAGLLKNTNYIVKHEYEEIEYNSENELFIVQKSSKQGVINKQGNEILPIEYDYILFTNDEINAQKDEKIYYYDMTGKAKEKTDNITKLSTQNAQYFITIDENDKFGVIDKDNNTIIKNIYQYIEYAYNDYFVATNSKGKLGVLNSEGKLEIDFNYNVIQKLEDKNNV